MLVLVLMVKITCLIVAIFAFATTCSVSVYVGFTVRCARDNSTTDYRLGVSYPFRLEKESFVVTLCNGSHQTLTFVEGASGSSQFYVFVGITAFLYSLIALFIYVCFDAFYRKNNSVIAIDFLFTCMFAVFWLIASSAWAQGVSDVKYFTDPTTGVFPSAAVCRVPGNKCSTGVPGDFTTLNVSIVFGFLNTLVWGGHVWFLYKETPWFKIRAIPTDPGVPNPAEAQLV